MFRSQIIVLLSLWASPALGGQQTWDIATFDAPNWAKQQSNDVVGYTDVDRAAGTYCQLAISNSQVSTGDARKDFAAEWKDLVVSVAAPDHTPTPIRGKTPGGLTYLTGGSMVTQSGARHFFQLFTFSSAGRRLSVQVSSASARGVATCQRRLGAFFSSLRVRANGAPSAPVAASSTPVAAEPRPGPGDVGRFGGGGLSGVWMGVRQDLLRGGAPQLDWVVFFDDGQFFQNLPNEGLLRFDRAASRANLSASWGTYTWSGGTGRMKKPGVEARFDTKLAAGKNGQVLLDRQPYFRCPRVDGLKLQGAWTSYANPADPSLDGPPTSPRPVIHFTRDGRFVDEGVFATFLQSSYGGDQTQDAPGQGTYTIKDFSLILRFADGRVKQLGFTGSLSLDPAKDDSTIYLNRSRFAKRR